MADEEREGWGDNYQNALAALRMIRETIETLGPPGVLPSRDTVFNRPWSRALACFGGNLISVDLWRAKRDLAQGRFEYCTWTWLDLAVQRFRKYTSGRVAGRILTKTVEYLVGATGIEPVTPPV